MVRLDFWELSAEKAGLSPRRWSVIVAASEMEQYVHRAEHRHHEAANQDSGHRVGEHLQHRLALLRLAAVSAGGPAVLFHGEVLLLGVALGRRAHRTGRRVAVGQAAGEAAQGTGRLNLVGREARPGGPIIGHGGRDRSDAKYKGSDDGGDTGLHGLNYAPSRNLSRVIRANSSCVNLTWCLQAPSDVHPHTRHRGLKRARISA